MIVERIAKCLGYQQVNAAGTVAAFKLSIPTNREVLKPKWCVIQAEAQALRYRDDGTAPTSAVGMLIPAGTSIEYSGDMNNIQLINGTAGAIANILYYQ